MPGILVVEDDENLNRGITFSLKKCAHQTVTWLGKCVPQPIPTHVETVVLLSQLKQKPDDYIKEL